MFASFDVGGAHLPESPEGAGGSQAHVGVAARGCPGQRSRSRISYEEAAATDEARRPRPRAGRKGSAWAAVSHAAPRVRTTASFASSLRGWETRTSRPGRDGVGEAIPARPVLL